MGWIPAFAGKTKWRKPLQAKLEAVFFSSSLSGLTRQSRDFGQPQNPLIFREEEFKNDTGLWIPFPYQVWDKLSTGWKGI